MLLSLSSTELTTLTTSLMKLQFRNRPAMDFAVIREDEAEPDRT
jgi:hypothetical protein